jgi:hypothetical protein
VEGCSGTLLAALHLSIYTPTRRELCAEAILRAVSPTTDDAHLRAGVW